MDPCFDDWAYESLSNALFDVAVTTLRDLGFALERVDLRADISGVCEETADAISRLFMRPSPDDDGLPDLEICDCCLADLDLL